MDGANPPPRYFDIHPTSNNSALPQQNEAPLNSEVASSSSASSDKEPHPDQFTEITHHETGLSSRDNGTGRRKSAFHRISRKVTKPFASKPGGDWRDCVFLISTILFVGSLIAIAIVGALVIRPYILVKSFTETNCTVVSAVLGTTTTRCSCGSGNICKYNCQKPCMRVKVSYKDPTSGLNITTKLSKTELGLIDECYSDNYGPITSSFTCLYNPDRLEQVIIYRTLNLAAAVNSILWFGILFLATSAFLVYYFLVYREYGKTIKKKLCKNKEYIAYP